MGRTRHTYTAEFKQIPSIDRTLANRYKQQLEDIQEWLATTRWSQSQLEVQTADKVQNTLINLKLIKKVLSSDEILTNQ